MDNGADVSVRSPGGDVLSPDDAVHGWAVGVYVQQRLARGEPGVWVQAAAAVREFACGYGSYSDKSLGQLGFETRGRLILPLDAAVLRSFRQLVWERELMDLAQEALGEVVGRSSGELVGCYRRLLSAALRVAHAEARGLPATCCH